MGGGLAVYPLSLAQLQAFVSQATGKSAGSTLLWAQALSVRRRAAPKGRPPCRRAGKNRRATGAPAPVSKPCIAAIAGFTGAPIMIIGDMLQAGEAYAKSFFSEIRRFGIANELAFEFFHPPSRRFVKLLEESVENFNVELSPESHDLRVRSAFGKKYNNRELESALETLVASRCRRIDLFFMVGLPYQSYSSVMESVAYCGKLLDRYGRSGKLLPMLAPLPPFVDSGSSIFAQRESMGSRVHYRTLGELR